MKNMKIEVETDELGESNLDEIVGELERLGFERTYYTQNTSGKWVRTCNVRKCDLATLAELRSMNIETLKEMQDASK